MAMKASFRHSLHNIMFQIRPEFFAIPALSTEIDERVVYLGEFSLHY